MLKWVQLNNRLFGSQKHLWVSEETATKASILWLWSRISRAACEAIWEYTFIHLNRTCELGWSEPTVKAAHVSPSPAYTLFCLSVLCCIVTRAHSAGRLVCMLRLIIASGKTTFLCKSECIADCMCCDNRQTGRRTQTASPLTQTLAFPVTAEPVEQLPNLADHNCAQKSESHWDLWGYGWGGIWIPVRCSAPSMYSFASVDWNWCKCCFLKVLYSPLVSRKNWFTQMERLDR